jgi:uncharacterized protein YjcR
VNDLSRSQSPERKKAFKIWVASGRKKKPAEIAAELGISASMVRKWKSLDKWEELPDPKRGAPKGNRNAKGNKGGPGGPTGNDKAVTHGLFRKFLPNDPEYHEIFDATEEMTPLEMLWHQIRIAWTNILWAQRPMHVTSKDEMIKELKKAEYEVHGVGRGDKRRLERIAVIEEYEFQFAWDRQATALNAQSQAMDRLARMIKQYDELLRTIPPEEVQDEQRTRIEKLKLEVATLKKDHTPVDPVVFKDDLHE